MITEILDNLVYYINLWPSCELNHNHYSYGGKMETTVLEQQLKKKTFEGNKADFMGYAFFPYCVFPHLVLPYLASPYRSIWGMRDSLSENISKSFQTSLGNSQAQTLASDLTGLMWHNSWNSICFSIYIIWTSQYGFQTHITWWKINVIK